MGGFRAAAQNWWVTADGGVIYYTAILPKLWPTALGTDEGVRPPTGKSCTGPSNTDGSRACVEDGRVTVVTSIGGMCLRIPCILVVAHHRQPVTKPSHRPGVSAARKCRP